MLLEVLKKHRADQNTLLIFLGDNGPDFVRAKTSCYLAGVRVPFIVRWPGVVGRGRVSDALVSGVDIAPTLLAAASAGPEEDYRMSGVSLLPVLRETQDSVRQVLPVEYTAHAGGADHFFPRRGLTDGKYLYIKNLLAGTRNPVVIQPWKMPREDHPMHEPLQRFIHRRRRSSCFTSKMIQMVCLISQNIRNTEYRWRSWATSFSPGVKRLKIGFYLRTNSARWRKNYRHRRMTDRPDHVFKESLS